MFDKQWNFWNDYFILYFFVLLNFMLLLDEWSVSYIGIGLENVFVMSVYCNLYVIFVSFCYLLNYELMYYWIGGKIQNVVNEELLYWFIEGFIDYFV